MLIEEQMQLVEFKLPPAVRDLRFSDPDSARPLTRRDSHKEIRSSPSCHMTNGRHRRAHLQARQWLLRMSASIFLIWLTPFVVAIFMMPIFVSAQPLNEQL